MTDTSSTSSPATLEWVRERQAALSAKREALEQRLTKQQVAWKTARDAVADLEQRTEAAKQDVQRQIDELQAQMAALDERLSAECKPHTKAMSAAVCQMVDKDKQPIDEVAVRLGVTAAEVRKARSAAKPKRRRAKKADPVSKQDHGPVAVDSAGRQASDEAVA